MDRKLLRQVCADIGVSRRAVQGYEKAGLVSAVGKNKYGYLLYDTAGIERIRTIRFLQRIGFSLKEIRCMVDEPPVCQRRALQAQLELGFCVTDEDYQRSYPAPRQLVTSTYTGQADSGAAYQDTITSAAAQSTFGYDSLYFAADRLCDQDGVAVVSQTLIRNADDEDVLLLEAEDRSEAVRLLTVSEVSINDLLVEPDSSAWETVAPGKRCILAVELSSLLAPGTGRSSASRTTAASA